MKLFDLYSKLVLVEAINCCDFYFVAHLGTEMI